VYRQIIKNEKLKPGKREQKTADWENRGQRSGLGCSGTEGEEEDDDDDEKHDTLE
jgi:ribosomal protein L15